MTATRRTRRPATRNRGGRGLRIHGGWALTGLVVLLGMAKTWPIQTAILLGFAVPALFAYIERPPRLAHIWHALDWIAARRRALPRPGQGARTLGTFLNLTPTGFERAITELALEDDNVAHAQHVGQANDRGADVLVHMRDGRRILIQCKQHQPGNNVGSAVIQTINGVYRDIHHCHAAVIVTTARFTRDAYNTNAMLQHPIRLIDGHALTTWANGGPPPWN